MGTPGKRRTSDPRDRPQDRDAQAAALWRWRRDLLARTGLAADAADRVAADARFDVHGLIDLVEQGCPPHLAVRILAPLDAEAPSGAGRYFT
jgi:hypothetical protein